MSKSAIIITRRATLVAVLALLALVVTKASLNTARVNRDADFVTLCSDNDLAGVKTALLAGADPDAPAWHDYKPIEWAVTRRNPEMLRLLIRHGASVRQASASRALCTALKNKDEQSALILLSKMDRADIQPCEGRAPCDLTTSEQSRLRRLMACR